ncbi:4585_t:CDS:1, partial [Rhizophagus irregularis]
RYQSVIVLKQYSGWIDDLRRVAFQVFGRVGIWWYEYPYF